MWQSPGTMPRHCMYLIRGKQCSYNRDVFIFGTVFQEIAMSHNSVMYLAMTSKLVPAASYFGFNS